MPADTPGITADGHGGNGGGDGADRGLPDAAPSAGAEKAPDRGACGNGGAGNETNGGGPGVTSAGGNGGATTPKPFSPATAPAPTPRRGPDPAPSSFAPARAPAPAPGGTAPSGAAPTPTPTPTGPVPTPIPGPGPGPGPGGLGPPPGAAPGIPPPPVLAPEGPGGLHRRARHAPERPAEGGRKSRRGLRVNQRLWSIDPWSVFKISALFFLCVGLIVLVAGTLLYNAGRSAGTIDQFESFVTRLGAYGNCTPKAELPKGTEFEADDDCADGQVLVGGFKLDDGTLFRAAAMGVGILVVAGSIGTVLLTVLVNLLNEMTGGLRHTVIREPVGRPKRGSPARRIQR